MMLVFDTHTGSNTEAHFAPSNAYLTSKLNVELKLFVSSRLWLVKCLIAVCRSSLHFYYFIREPIPTFFYNKTLNLMCIIYWNHKWGTQIFRKKFVHFVFLLLLMLKQVEWLTAMNLFSQVVIHLIIPVDRFKFKLFFDIPRRGF